MKIAESKLIRSVRRSIPCFAAVLALGVASLGVVVGTASAATAALCPGNIVYNTSDSVGEMAIYYSTSSGGTNCAVTEHLGSIYGVTKRTSIYLIKCNTGNPNNECIQQGPAATDDNNYAYYAGPVSQTSTNNHCIFAEGRIYYAPDIRYYDTPVNGTACG